MTYSNYRSERKNAQTFRGSCDTCAFLSYDEDFEEYLCSIDMDEDDWARLLESNQNACPYYRNGDEYAVVRHQN